MWLFILATNFLITSVLCQGDDITSRIHSLQSMNLGYNAWGESSLTTHQDQKTRNSLTPISSDLKATETVVNPSQRSKRNLINLYNVMSCGTSCYPYKYLEYGCHCGPTEKYPGLAVDGIDRCCERHDQCYGEITCSAYAEYWAPYSWDCSNGKVKCDDGRGFWSWFYSLFSGITCPHKACGCDRAFEECLQLYPCPITKPACRRW